MNVEGWFMGKFETAQIIESFELVWCPNFNWIRIKPIILVKDLHIFVDHIGLFLDF